MKNQRPALSASDWSRLNSLLEQAMSLDGDDRAAWLRGLGDDEAHLLPLLTDLLAESGTDATARQEARVTASVAVVASAALGAMQREQPGDRIGPWQLERLLAEGGMGSVWMARRADGVVRRTAALKLPRAEWVDRGLTGRIAREGAILARLRHPHIAVLYDAGLGPEGRPYLALEYVDGVPIDAWCKGRDLATVVRLSVQVVRAVAHAHAQLVIHRDLKPANVLVTADGTPKLLDFGISKLLEGETPTVDETALTQLVGRRLTLAYAAPEQVLGLPISVAADVYALGAMIFELASGQRLYRAGEPHALQAEILRSDHRKPSDATADRARARELKGDLDAIILTALKREPSERYQSASALADDLDSYLAGQPVKAQPDSRAYRLRKFVARNRLPVATVVAVVVALGVGLAAALWQAERANALTTFTLSLIRQADPNASRQTRASDLAMLASIESKIDQEFRGSPAQLLQLRLTVGEAYRNRGEMMAARRVFQRAVDDAQPHVPADNLLMLTARVRASDYNLIVSTAASEQLDQAIDILRRQKSRSAAAAELLIDALLIRNGLQLAYGLPAHVPAERRLDLLREANAVAASTFGEGSRQHLRVAAATENWLRNIEGRPAARRVLESALLQARQRGDGTDATVEYLGVRARSAALHCEDRAERAESAATLRAALEQVRAMHGPTSVLLEDVQMALGRCLRAAGDPAALAADAAAYEIAAARERPPSTNVMGRALNAFHSAMLAHDFAAAERFYQSAMQNAEAIPEPALRGRLTTLARISHVCLLVQVGQPAAAEQAAAPLIAEFDAVYAKVGRLTPRQDELWTCLSNAQREQRRLTEALRTLQTFAERCRTTKLSPELALRCEGDALIEQALLELDMGRIAAAQATLEARRAMSRDMAAPRTYALAYGRVLLATGRAAEAIEPLRNNHEAWLSFRPDSPYTAEALYWLGRSIQAAGEPRGRLMVARAREALAHSPLSTHQRLAVDDKAR